MQKKKLSAIQKRQDRYAIESKNSVIQIIERNMLGVASGYLNYLQAAIGKDHEKFPILRKMILDTSNDVVRKITHILEQKYNIQLIPGYQYILKVKDKAQEGN